MLYLKILLSIVAAVTLVWFGMDSQNYFGTPDTKRAYCNHLEFFIDHTENINEKNIEIQNYKTDCVEDFYISNGK